MTTTISVIRFNEISSPRKGLPHQTRYRKIAGNDQQNGTDRLEIGWMTGWRFADA